MQYCLLEVFIVCTQRLTHNTALSLYHTELMSLVLSITIRHHTGPTASAPLTLLQPVMKTTLTLISVYPEQNIMKLLGTDLDNEKYALIEKFHVSSTTGPVNMWYCFVVGVTPFGLSNAICLVGHVGRGNETKQRHKTCNRT